MLFYLQDIILLIQRKQFIFWTAALSAAGLLLDQGADVEEAIERLQMYDLHAFMDMKDLAIYRFVGCTVRMLRRFNQSAVRERRNDQEDMSL